jgi:hypothetical protein
MTPHAPTAKGLYGTGAGDFDSDSSVHRRQRQGFGGGAAATAASVAMPPAAVAALLRAASRGLRVATPDLPLLAAASGGGGGGGVFARGATRLRGLSVLDGAANKAPPTSKYGGAQSDWGPAGESSTANRWLKSRHLRPQVGYRWGSGRGP